MTDIRTFDGQDKLAQAAADLILETARQSVRDRGEFVWGLSGGSTPAMLYRLLAEDPYGARMPWEQAFVFSSDERWVSPDHRDSNQRMAKSELLERMSIPPPTSGPSSPWESNSPTPRQSPSGTYSHCSSARCAQT